MNLNNPNEYNSDQAKAEAQAQRAIEEVSSYDEEGAICALLNSSIQE